MSEVANMLAKIGAASEYAKTSPVEVIRMTMLSLIVCAPSTMGAQEVETESNKINISGTSNGWSIREDDNPVRCDKHPDKQHWILDAW